MIKEKLPKEPLANFRIYMIQQVLNKILNNKIQCIKESNIPMLIKKNRCYLYSYQLFKNQEFQSFKILNDLSIKLYNDFYFNKKQ